MVNPRIFREILNSLEKLFKRSKRFALVSRRERGSLYVYLYHSIENKANQNTEKSLYISDVIKSNCAIMRHACVALIVLTIFDGMV